jgi:hypothetical protein
VLFKWPQEKHPLAGIVEIARVPVNGKIPIVHLAFPGQAAFWSHSWRVRREINRVKSVACTGDKLRLGPAAATWLNPLKITFA